MAEKRKIPASNYTRAFYVETRVEALERQVATRAKMTDVLNRSQDSKLKTQKKRKKIKESTPSAKRRRQSKKILTTRKNIKNKVHLSFTEDEGEDRQQTHIRAASADLPVHHGIRPQTTGSGGRSRHVRLPAINPAAHHSTLGAPPDRPRTDQASREDHTAQRSGPPGQRLRHRGQQQIGEDTSGKERQLPAPGPPTPSGPGGGGGQQQQQRFPHRLGGLT
ncbi:hypothetical protein ElyMa_004191700 [Elysia marginata]|uniref:Uncharacterized protein n=1 Tax=Elysia marginata TaxID=1093978 RepID=A0AAV4GKS1_9GAST|nr:hypothetical protein ElyMa_004191700 [Elysia marginata]